MGDRLIMSKKERDRKVILEQIKLGQLKHNDAAKRLKLSCKQIGRILKKYKTQGDAGLIHQSRGKPSYRAYSQVIKDNVLALYREKYMDFGPTFAMEKMFEEDSSLTMHHETLRLWLKEAGLFEPRRKRKAHRQRRERRARFGELLQLDGSIHAWLPGQDGKQCLMNMVDDATGKTLALLDTGETTHAAFALLRWWIQEAGIPMAIYVDLKSVYIAPKSLRTDENDELIEPDWLTHFGKACDALGIELIKAYSPQAKGRVERSHAVYQDRFVKELKLQNIQTIDEANKLLSESFVNHLNEKFAKPAANLEDAHVQVGSHVDLDQIFCWEFSRIVRNDYTIQFENQHFQIRDQCLKGLRPKAKITVKRHMDQSITLWLKNQALTYEAVTPEKEEKKETEKKGHNSHIQSKNARANRHKTPWGQFNKEWLHKRQKPIAAYPQGTQSA